MAAARPNPYTLTQDLARECYERYRTDYEGLHHVTLATWSDLAREVQGRWSSALKPVAEKLRHVLSLEEDLEETRTHLNKLHDADDRASARLSKLEDAVHDARRVLPDMIALGSVPAPLVVLLTKLATALEEAQVPNTERPVAA